MPVKPGNPRGRGTYNPACDVCARKKIKCDGIKPVCQPCQSQGREKECAWTKNPVRKPRTEASFEAMHKQAEIFRKRVAELHRYTDLLESLVDECRQHHPQHQSIDFRALRPSDSDGLPDEPEFDFIVDQGSDDGNDPAVRAINIPPGNIIQTFTGPSRFPALAEDPDNTYVLLVEGVESTSHHYNPAFDWSRHLGSAVPLDRRSHDKALDLLFKFFTSWCLRIVPALFLRDMYRALRLPATETPPNTPHYSPMLHNALVALALALLDDPKFRDLKSRQYFANAAKSFIDHECQKPNLSVVHALSILASFHSSQGDQTLGYLYFGMSARMSQALGLNNDCLELVKLGYMDEADRLDRHWANLTIFTQDVCWSLYVGRDFCVPAPTDASAVRPHIDPDFDEMPWFHLPAGIAPQPNNLTKTFEATYRLLLIARRIMDVVNGLNMARSRPLVLDALIIDIDVQLNQWKESLDPDIEITPRSLPTATPHKLMLHLSYWWLFILLHRPFVFRKSRPIHSADREIDHVKLCRRAAEHIMQLLLTWRNLYTLRYCPVTLIQTVFCAGTVYLLIAMQASSGIRVAEKELRHSLDQEALVRQYLEEIGLSWKSATNITGTLRVIMREQVRPILEQRYTTVTKGLHIPSDAGQEEEDPGSSSSSKSSHTCNRFSSTKRKRRRIISSVPGQSSLSFTPKHILISPTSPTQAPPSQAMFSSASAHQAPSTHVAPSSPIAIVRSQSSTSSFSSSPSSFPDLRSLQPSSAQNGSPIPTPGSSPLFYYSASFSNRGFQGYAQPSSDCLDDLFSGNGHGASEDGFGSQPSFLTYNFQFSSSQPSNYYTGRYLGMAGGQPLSEAPFLSNFSEEDTHNPHFQHSSQLPSGTGLLNHESSLSSHIPSSSHNNDGMDIDNTLWDQYLVQNTGS